MLREAFQPEAYLSARRFFGTRSHPKHLLAFRLGLGQNSAEDMRVNARLSILLIAWLVLAAIVAGCGGGGGTGTRSADDGGANLSPLIYTVEEAQQQARWTVLVYLDADNDLESAGIRNFNQMEVVGSTQDVHVIVQMDRKSGTDPDNDDWTDTRRYLITRDTDPKVMRSVRLDTPPLGELNMADGATLGDFVAWGKSNFPADNYLLVIWDHGTGWQTRSLDFTPRYKYIAADDTSGSEMNITDIPLALTGLSVDVIALDACYMQQLEVAYELRNCADYMVASSAAEPSPGYNYARVLSHISGDSDPAQLSRTIVQQYAVEYATESNITQSAVDLANVGALADAASDFALILDANRGNWAATLADARSHSLDYASSGTRRYSLDLIDYTSRCAGVIGGDANDAYAQLQAAFGAAVIASVHSSDLPNAHGLAIYVPPPLKYDNSYGMLSLAGDTAWDEWLRGQQQ